MAEKGASGFLMKSVDWRVTAIAGPCLVVLVLGVLLKTSGYDGSPPPYDAPWKGANYLKTEGGKEYLLASQNGDKKEWFDITGLPLDKHRFQYGIGKDRIASIDDPVFVEPDDPRLLRLGRGRLGGTNDLRVIGYAAGGVARAYPIGLLDHHELVNDTIAGKPITVGW